MRAHRIFASALLISLAIHLLLLASAGSWWAPPAAEISFLIEANLVAPVPKPAPATPAVAKPKPKPKAVRAAPVAPASVVDTPAPRSPVEPPPEVAAAPETTPVSAIPVAETPAPPAAAQQEPAAPAGPALPPALRKLPDRLNLRYAVQVGEGGFTLGRAIYSWQQRDGRYSLVSIAQATGLTSLFVGGKLVQTSEGTITANGLRPEQYWLSRNERKQDTARFDWNQGRLVQGGGGSELPAGSQDVLSFPFHLAMTVDDTATEWDMAVTNGSKLRQYHFRNLGHESLAQGEAGIDTLHLQGSRTGEGTLDVWLAPSQHWLPLRIRTLDQKGKVLVLNLEEGS